MRYRWLLLILLACSPGEPTSPSLITAQPTTWTWTTGLETDQPFITKWSHPGAVVVRTTERDHTGSWSLKMTTPDTIYKRASALKVFPFAAQIHAVDLWFYIPTSSGSNVALEVALEGWSGTREHLASIHWVTDATYNLHGWRMWVDCPTCSPWTGKWVFLPGGQNALLSFGKWHHLTIEVDYTTGTYRRVAIDGRVFDLTGLAYDAANRITQGSSYQVSILLWTQRPQKRTAYVDDVKVGRVQ